MNIYTIGVAEQKIAKAPDKLVTLGLGSCVGLVLYDPTTLIAGMVHIMLPTAPPHITPTNRFKFADSAVVDMISLLVDEGAARRQLCAKMAGGAHMFQTARMTDIMNVGQRNVEMCKKMLAENCIPIKGEDTGGTSGRSIEFCCQTLQLSIRTVSPKAVKVI